MSESQESDDQVDQAFAAYLRSCDEGLVSSREEFLCQFPAIADELRELMDAADAIDTFTSGVLTSPLYSGELAKTGFAQAGENGTELSDTGELPKPVSPSDETVDRLVADPNESDDPALTLPEANRPQGDVGPTLPYDIGEYQLQQVIGRGGMGVVYKANQYMLNRTVAVKMIRGGMLACENDVRRFYTEAQAAAGLSHPGIVPVYQFGHHRGHHYFSMALIEGTDLQRRINDGPIEIEDAARYVRDVALAIDHAHHNHVLHRDLKPANILIDSRDQVHVTDFGLAKNLTTDSSVTGSGAAVGTPNYMAPEQAGGHSDRASRKSDVYSLGAILFAAVTGRPPLVGDTIVDTLMQVIHDRPEPMRNFRSGVPQDLETIVSKCLEKQPAKRYQSAADLAADLDAFLEGRPIMARPRGKIVQLWHGFTGIPLVGALLGRKVVRTSPGHRRLQAGMLLMLALMPFLFVSAAMWSSYRQQAMPASVSIAGGVKNGVYNEFSAQLAARLQEQCQVDTQVMPTGGSIDNRGRLITRQVHLAPMQAAAINSNQLVVVAPLFSEYAHLMVRDLPDQAVIDDGELLIEWLREQSVAIGPEKSGSRMTAGTILSSLGLQGDVKLVEQPWDELQQSDASVALICIRPGSDLINQMFDQGWSLLALPHSTEVASHLMLYQQVLKPEHYPDVPLSAAGYPTVATTALLVTRSDAPDKLVQSTLRCLYESPNTLPGVISRADAANTQGLAFHDAALEYYSGETKAE